MRFRASQAAHATHGTLHGEDVVLDAVAFDSRALVPGQLFVPLVAERDGHDFLPAAVAAGAGATLASRPVEPGIPVIEVADTAAALMELAAWGRRQLTARVVGVTGSVGKTSTKDLIRAAVAPQRRVAANEKSFNNEQGLPTTILAAPDDTEVLVLEMGMRGFGQITQLCDIAVPEIGVVTAVGASHTEKVGGIEGVARAKAELVEALSADGTAVLNADDHRVAAMASRTAASVLTYGRAEGADLRITDLVLDELARARFTLHTPWGSADLALAVGGAHMAANAAAAMAVAGTLGVDLAVAAGALSTAALSGMRMQVLDAAGGGRVVNDAYNANPTSARAALDAIAAMDAERRVAVLGMMGELDDPAAGHREVAAHARDLGIELVAVGTDLYGIPGREADVVLAELAPVPTGTVVLVKASRSVGLDVLAGRLVDVR